MNEGRNAGRNPKRGAGLWLLTAITLPAWTLATLASCGTGRTVYVEGPERVRTEYRDRVTRDTVAALDSVFVSVVTRGDTVWLERNRWRVVEKIRWRTDSLHLRDSVRVTVRVPVERELTRWERTQMMVGRWALWAVCGGVVALTAWLAIRRYVLKKIRAYSQDFRFLKE